jgi:hypothetical protein
MLIQNQPDIFPYKIPFPLIILFCLIGSYTVIETRTI